MDIEAQQNVINPSSERLAMTISRRLGNITEADKKGSEKSLAESITNGSKSDADWFRETAKSSEQESVKGPGSNTPEQLKPLITASNEQSSIHNFPPNAPPSKRLEPPTATSLSKRIIAQRERRARERESKRIIAHSERRAREREAKCQVVHGTPETQKAFRNVSKNSAEKDGSFIINQVPTLKTYKRKRSSLLAQQSSPGYGRAEGSTSSDTNAPDPPDVNKKILSLVQNRVEPGNPEDIFPLMSVSPMGTLIEGSSINSCYGHTSVAMKALSPSSLSSDLICKRGNLLCWEGQTETELPDAAKCFESPLIEFVKGKETEIVAHGTDTTHAGTNPEMRIPFVKSSFLWKSLESMETFQQMPQNPCFRQLETHNEEYREGIAIGLMVNFDNLVRRVGRLCISDSLSTFKQMLESLATFEENGFYVQPIQSRIEKLLQIKDFQKQLKKEMTLLEEQLLGNAYEDSRLDTQYCELDKTIMKMERKLASLHEERNSVHNQRMAIRLKNTNLQKDVQTAEEKCLSAEQCFNTVVGSPW